VKPLDAAVFPGDLDLLVFVAVWVARVSHDALEHLSLRAVEPAVEEQQTERARERELEEQKDGDDSRDPV
jgi:hypothetical protein